MFGQRLGLQELFLCNTGAANMPCRMLKRRVYKRIVDQHKYQPKHVIERNRYLGLFEWLHFHQYFDRDSDPPSPQFEFGSTKKTHRCNTEPADNSHVHFERIQSSGPLSSDLCLARSQPYWRSLPSDSVHAIWCFCNIREHAKRCAIGTKIPRAVQVLSRSGRR